MKSKITFKNSIICSIVVTIMCTILFVMSNIIQYRIYNRNLNYKISEIIEEILIDYPNINETDVIKILNSGKIRTSNLLEEYGINLSKDTAIYANMEYFTIWSIASALIILLLAVSILIIFIIYNKSKDRKVAEITGYIEEINKKNYSLKMDDNSEDELSILQNELYKTTIMLKEEAENLTEDKMNLKNSLVDISHQLKTPLTSITIMLDNILDEPNMTKEVRNSFIKDIRREISSINFLVQALLKLSKFDTNTIVYNRKLEKLDNIIEVARKNVMALCDLKNIAVLVEGDPNITLNCDPIWQIEALTNIIKNCVEHSYENSNIMIKYEENKLYYKIEVIDNGVGIPENELPHIFERFYKGKNSDKDSIGVGLALAKAIIEEDSGVITVDSTENKGTMFTIKYFKNS